ncbi:MAG: hypothetical protein WCB67_05265 [Solirubrobacteraceae bacterium]
MPKLPETRSILRRGSALALGAALAATGAAALPAAASANSSQLAIIQDNLDLTNPEAAFGQFRALGANTVRVIVPWALIAPSFNAKKKPNFNATDPNAYPAKNWVPYDNIVRAAQADGLTVDMTVTGGAPVWADGSGIPPQGKNPAFAWKPNAKYYGEFVTAVGKRYNGHTDGLPAVHFWALFNEPNFGQDLGPQAINGSRTSYAPMLYRGIVNAGWKALQGTGHGNDTILIGEFAARGSTPSPPSHRAPQGFPGNYGQTKPLQFIRTLYCLSPSYRQLRGSAARSVGCPTSAAGSRRFRAQNPGLFSASGVSAHPYPDNLSPVRDGRSDPDFAAFPDLGNLARTLDRATGSYGVHRRFSIYNTEYGYITSPPASRHYVSQATASYYINWAEYLSYKNSRVKSYMQYLLMDPPGSSGAYAGFASGLETASGVHKANYDAYRMPFYMPRTSFSHTASVEVWGNARPAGFEKLGGYGTQQAQVQEQIGSAWKTLNTVNLNGAQGYFDVKMKFPSSGQVRLQWTYPTDPLLPSGFSGHTIYSRSFNIKVH